MGGIDDETRAPELTRLVDALAPRGANALLIGEAGVGKMTLAAQAPARLSARLGGELSVIQLRADPALRPTPLGAFAAHLPELFAEPPAGVRAQRDALLAAFAGQPAGEPLLIVRGLHDLDGDSLALLDALAEDLRLRLLVTSRSSQAVPAGLERLRRDRSASRIVLGPLDPERTAALAARLLGAERVEEETGWRLHDTTRGNPLYLGELIDALDRNGELARRHGTVAWIGEGHAGADALTELVRGELARLSLPERRALELVAVTGPIGAGVAEELSDPGAIAAVQVQGLLRATPDDAAGTLLTVAHPVVAAATRALCPALSQIALNRSVLHALRPRLDGAGPEQLARAVTVALRAEQQPPIAWVRSALEHAVSVSDYPGTARVATAMLAHPDAGLDDLVRAHATRALSARLGGGRAAEYSDGVAAAELLRSPALTPEQVVALSLAVADSKLYVLDDPAAALSVIDAARARIAEAPDAAEALLDLEIGRALRLGYAGWFAEAATAITALRERRLPAERLLPLAAIECLLHSQRGRIRSARGLALRTLPVASRSTRSFPGVSDELAAAWFSAELFNGRLAVAATMHSGISRALRNNPQHPSHGTGIIGIGDGTRALCEGRWRDAAASLSSSVDRLARSDGNGFTAVAVSSLALALAASGDRVGAQQAIGEAEAGFLRASRSVEGLIRLNTLHARLWLGAEGSAGHATALAAWAAERGLDLVELRALHALALVSPAAVPRLTARTAELAAGMDTSLGRTLHRHCVELVAGGDSADSPTARQLARLGLWVPFEMAAALTTREREVASLAALGYSSKRIAAMLHLSKRTVETHLGRSFLKLHVTDREDLAAALSLRGSR